MVRSLHRRQYWSALVLNEESEKFGRFGLAAIVMRAAADLFLGKSDDLLTQQKVSQRSDLLTCSSSS